MGVTVAHLLQIPVDTSMMVDGGRYRTGGFNEIPLLGLMVALLSARLTASAIFVLGTTVFPRATALIVPFIALRSMVGGRAACRNR